MKIREDMKSIYVGDLSTRVNNGGIRKKEEGAEAKHSIFAGNLREDNNEIAVKRKQAQTKAYKIVSDANKNETSIDNEVDKRKQYISELEDSSTEKLKEIKEYKDYIEELKEKYGVSKEDMKSDSTGAKDKGLSDYEKEMQAYEQAIEKLSQEVKQNQDAIDNERMTLNAIALSRLKQHGMVDAQKTADSVIVAASKEIVETMMDQAVEQVEDNINEIQEKQEKIEEEKEKLDAKDKIEEKQTSGEIKSKAEEKTQTVDAKLENNNHFDVLKQLNKVLVEEKLMDEDLKGIILDEQI